MYKEKFTNVLNENENIIRIEKAKMTTCIMKKIIYWLITIAIIFASSKFVSFIALMEIRLNFFIY